LGFNAIWISPIPDNYPNQFHGYAAKNMTQVNEHFGGETALKSLIDACHKQGTFLKIKILFISFSVFSLSLSLFSNSCLSVLI